MFCTRKNWRLSLQRGHDRSRQMSLDYCDNGLFTFARSCVEIAQGAERLEQPIVVVCFPHAGIDPQLRHRLAIEASVQLPLQARRLEGTCDLGDLRRAK